MTENKSLRDSIFYNIAMFLFSFSIMATQAIFMHQLLIITNYITATFVISIAMIGLAAGGFVSFYLARIKGYVVMMIISLFYFASIPLSYYNIIRIGEYQYPYFLVLPFFFAAVIVSLLFTRGNSNRIYFTNLAAAACGVMSKKAWEKVPRIHELVNQNKVIFIDAVGDEHEKLTEQQKERIVETERYGAKVILILQDAIGWESYIYLDNEYQPWFIEKDVIGFYANVYGDFTEMGSIGVKENEYGVARVY